MKRKSIKTGICMAMAALLAVAPMGQVSFAKSVEADAIQVNVSEEEIETNGTVLPLNQVTTNRLRTRNEEQWYKFELTETGHFNIRISINAGADANAAKNGWNVSLYRKGNLQEAIKKLSTRTSAGTNELVLEAGTYYIQVCAESHYSDSVAPLGCDYDIAVNHTPDASFEKEGNDTSDKSELIETNKLYKGSLYFAKDEDWYVVELEDSANLQVTLKTDSTTDINAVKDGWTLNIYDSNLTKVKSYTYIKSEKVSAVLPYEKGKYYVQILATSSYSDSVAPVDAIYNLQINATHEERWEAEYNDSNVAANVILPDETYSGTLYQRTDEDWYKVTTAQKGYFQIVFDAHINENLQSVYNGWRLTLYDKNLTAIREYTDVKADLTSMQIPYEAGTYYIKVNAQSSYSDTVAPVDCTYSLAVKQTKTDNWEQENNNTRQSANKISLNKTYSGYMETEKDEDWYQFTTSKKGAVKISLGKNKNAYVDNVKNGWSLYLYKKSSSNEMQMVKNIKTADSMTASLGKGTYCLKVVGTDTYSSIVAPVNSIYDLKVKYAATPGTAKITSVKAGKKQAVLKWGKVKDATGYYIYRSTSQKGAYKKVATVKKAATTTYTDKKSLKSNKQYYYKIICYRTENGVTAKGSASAVKSVKVK